MRARNAQIGEEPIEYLDKPGDPVIDRRFIRAPKTEQVECDDPMRGRKCSKQNAH
jgi:hypothetical protein